MHDLVLMTLVHLIKHLGCHSLSSPSSRSADVSSWAQDRQLINRLLQQHLYRARNRMKMQTDKHRSDHSFAVGDFVFLKLQPYVQSSLAPRANAKLAFKYFGPYQVIGKIGSVAYKLQLPPTAAFHDVFHVSLLKKFEGTPPTSVVPLPDLLNGRVLPSPEKVVRARLNRGVWELLVQWIGRAPSDATWENLLEFKSAYPSVQLEDALFVGEGEMLSTVLWVASTTGRRR